MIPLTPPGNITLPSTTPILVVNGDDPFHPDFLQAKINARPSVIPEDQWFKMLQATKPTGVDKYKGKNLQELMLFEKQCISAFRSAPLQCFGDYNKVLFAEKQLDKEASAQWHRYADAHPADRHVWTSFLAFLRDSVMAPRNRELQIHKEYTEARQKSSETVREFDLRLAGLEAHLPPKTDVELVQEFLSRLKPDIATILNDQATVFLTRMDVVAHAQRIEENHKARRGLAHEPTTHNSNNDNPQSSRSRDKRSLRTPRRGGGGRRNNDRNNKPRTSTGSGTTERATSSHPNIECFYCKKMGHYSTECRKKKADDERVAGGTRIKTQALRTQARPAKSNGPIVQQIQVHKTVIIPTHATILRDNGEPPASAYGPLDTASELNVISQHFANKLNLTPCEDADLPYPRLANGKPVECAGAYKVQFTMADSMGSVRTFTDIFYALHQDARDEPML